MWYVYLLEARDRELLKLAGQGSRRYYVGSTCDLYRRVREHNEGKCTATKGRGWTCIAYLTMPNEPWARFVERWLKKGDTRRKRMEVLRAYKDGMHPDKIGEAFRTKLGEEFLKKSHGRTKESVS